MPVQPTIGRMSLPEAQVYLNGGLVGLDVFQLREGVPPISKALRSGRLRYERRDEDEHWKNIREIWADGFGDCEDLASAIAAELIFFRGHRAELRLFRVRPGLVHAVAVDLTTGDVYDPSRTGGMGAP